MNINVLDQLIDDTLHARRGNSSNGSCLTVNQAGVELVHSEATLDALEGILRSQVDEPMRCGKANVAHFPGLDYVIGAYLVKAARKDAIRGTVFMESLSPPLVREIIANMPVFFRKQGTGYNFGVIPPSTYFEYVEAKCESDDVRIAETAKRVRDRWQKP